MTAKPLTKKIKKELKDKILEAMYKCDTEFVRSMLYEYPELLYENYETSNYINKQSYIYNIAVKNDKMVYGDENKDYYYFDCTFDLNPKKIINYCYLPFHKEMAKMLMEFGMHPDYKIKSDFIRDEESDYYDHRSETALYNLTSYLHHIIDNVHNISGPNNIKNLDVVLNEIRDYFCFLVDKGANPFLIVYPHHKNMSARYDDERYAYGYTSPFMMLMFAVLRIGYNKDRSKAAGVSQLKDMIVKSLNSAEPNNSPLFPIGIRSRKRIAKYDTKIQSAWQETERFIETPLQNIFHILCDLCGKENPRPDILDTLFEILEDYCSGLPKEEVAETAVKNNWYSYLAGKNIAVDNSYKSFENWKRTADLLSEYLPADKVVENDYIYDPLLNCNYGSSAKLAYYASHGVDLRRSDCEGNNIWHCLSEYFASNVKLKIRDVNSMYEDEINMEQIRTADILFRCFPEGINIKNKDGDTPLHFIYSAFADAVVRESKKEREKTYGFSEDELTDRIIKSANTLSMFVKHLIANGADPRILNNDGKYPEDVLPAKLRKLIDFNQGYSQTMEQDISIFIR